MNPVLKAVLYPLRDDDAPDERQRKMLFLTFYYVIILACTLAVITVKTVAGTIGSLFMIGTTLLWMAHIYATRELTLEGAEYYLYCVCVAGFIFDYNTAAGGNERFWPGFVIVIDMLLVCRIRDAVSKGIVLLIVLWLCFTALENSFRFGLYDLGGSTSYGEQKKRLDCTKPPCANVEAGLRNVIMYLCVFLLDFYFTRNFAKMVIAENRKMNSAVQTAQSVAKSLAAFDLDRSRLSLESNPDLPTELSDAFKSILSNLETYKEFLPQSCLPFELDCDYSATSQSDIVTERTTSHTDVLSSVLESSKEAAVHGPFHGDLKKKKVTLMVCNMSETLALLEQPEVLSDRQQFVLSNAVTAVKNSRGVIDGFVGDHVYASFNAVRSCAAHSDSAISASLQLLAAVKQAPVTVNAGVASGRALCGDMGCAGMKRYTITGYVSTWVNVVERLGAEWRIPVLVDNTVKVDSCLSFPLRLIEQRVVYKKCKAGDTANPLWEVVGDASLNTGISSEWMYEVDLNTCWERFNQALDAWVTGQPDVAISLCTAATPADNSPPELFLSMTSLAKRIRNGAVPAPPRVVHW